MHPEVLGATECQEQIARFTTLAYRAPEMVSLYSGKTISTKADIWVGPPSCVCVGLTLSLSVCVCVCRRSAACCTSCVSSPLLLASSHWLLSVSSSAFQPLPVTQLACTHSSVSLPPSPSSLPPPPVTPPLITAGYMLEADPDKRPSIWQVCHVAFRLHQLPNPVANVFVSLYLMAKLGCVGMRVSLRVVCARLVCCLLKSPRHRACPSPPLPPPPHEQQ